MLYETAIDLFRRTTALTPVEDKFGAHRLGENNIDAGLRQNVQRVLTRYPVPAKGGGTLISNACDCPAFASLCCASRQRASTSCLNWVSISLPCVPTNCAATLAIKCRGISWVSAIQILERSAGLPSTAFGRLEFSSAA
ncbi:MAG: hypothetical protein CM15mP89_2730 [Gammaproteobacteria bacterium]|nr:MAG: hypothetical protein CM15mP89_2730 [Gammaproteobacteria bacterium]